MYFFLSISGKNETKLLVRICCCNWNHKKVRVFRRAYMICWKMRRKRWLFFWQPTCVEPFNIVLIYKRLPPIEFYKCQLSIVNFGIQNLATEQELMYLLHEEIDITWFSIVSSIASNQRRPSWCLESKQYWITACHWK